MITTIDRFVVRSREEAHATFPQAPKQSFADYAAAMSAASAYNKISAAAFEARVDTQHPFIVVDTQVAGKLTRPEPPPRRTDGPAIWEMLIADMSARDQAGRAKYGTPLQAFNGRNPLVDAFQELMDLLVYLRQAIEEGRQLYPMPHHAREVAQALWKHHSSREPDQVDGWNRLSEQFREHLIDVAMRTLIEMEQKLPASHRGVSGIHSDDQLAIALKNVGVDISCAVCASIFYTGSSSPAPHTCQLQALRVSAALANKDFCGSKKWICASIPSSEGPADALIRVSRSGRLELQWCEDVADSWESLEWSDDVATATCRLIEPLNAPPEDAE